MFAGQYRPIDGGLGLGCHRRNFGTLVGRAWGEGAPHQGLPKLKFQNAGLKTPEMQITP